MLLTGKTVIVSGVGPGYGRELALACAREGADLALGARTESRLRAVQSEVEALGRRAVCVPADITDPAQCDRLVRTAHDELGRVDVLVHNAFRGDVFEPFEVVDLAAWRAIMEVNLFGSLGLTHSAVPVMKEQGSGSIVFVGSMIVRKPLPHQGGYATSKAALLTATQVLAKELGPHGIRVNSVVPGWRWGPTPDDCPGAVVFFASDLSAVVTGQSLDVNGGEVLR